MGGDAIRVRAACAELRPSAHGNAVAALEREDVLGLDVKVHDSVLVQLAQAIEDAGATVINTGIGWHEARIPTRSC